MLVCSLAPDSSEVGSLACRLHWPDTTDFVRMPQPIRRQTQYKLQKLGASCAPRQVDAPRRCT